MNDSTILLSKISLKEEGNDVAQSLTLSNMKVPGGALGKLLPMYKTFQLNNVNIFEADWDIWSSSGTREIKAEVTDWYWDTWSQSTVTKIKVKESAWSPENLLTLFDIVELVNVNCQRRTWISGQLVWKGESRRKEKMWHSLYH